MSTSSTVQRPLPTQKLVRSGSRSNSGRRRAQAVATAPHKRSSRCFQWGASAGSCSASQGQPMANSAADSPAAVHAQRSREQAVMTEREPAALKVGCFRFQTAVYIPKHSLRTLTHWMLGLTRCSRCLQRHPAAVASAAVSAPPKQVDPHEDITTALASLQAKHGPLSNDSTSARLLAVIWPTGQPRRPGIRKEQGSAYRRLHRLKRPRFPGVVDPQCSGGLKERPAQRTFTVIHGRILNILKPQWPQRTAGPCPKLFFLSQGPPAHLLSSVRLSCQRSSPSVVTASYHTTSDRGPHASRSCAVSTLHQARHQVSPLLPCWAHAAVKKSAKQRRQQPWPTNLRKCSRWAMWSRSILFSMLITCQGKRGWASLEVGATSGCKVGGEHLEH